MGMKNMKKMKKSQVAQKQESLEQELVLERHRRSMVESRVANLEIDLGRLYKVVSDMSDELAAVFRVSKILSKGEGLCF